MSLIIPNRILYAYLKKSKADKNIEINGFNDIVNNNLFKKFKCDNTAIKVLNYCESNGRMLYKFLSRGDVIIHKSKGVKDNIYISILSPNTTYFRRLYNFFQDFKDIIDFGGNTYVLDCDRFVCEFIRNKKTISYE